MLRNLRFLVGTLGAAFAAVALGFVVFAGYVTRTPVRDDTAADAIVVLTGAGLRISEAARLLEANRGRRLLISGVHPTVTTADIAKISGLDARLLDCCVDIDTKALDTVGNAAETRAWLDRHGFSSLILVTSNYHMPRSLAEFARVAPAARIEPHAVVPRGFPIEGWWLNPSTTKLLLSEYLKFLPSAVRLATARAMDVWQATGVASSPPRSMEGRNTSFAK
ncbi:MAG: YdcF family protein [Hyphomicrobiaceae bacterium]